MYVLYLFMSFFLQFSSESPVSRIYSLQHVNPSICTEIHVVGELGEEQRGVTHNDDDLRIVLLGKTGVGKSAAGNTILRKTAFTSKLASRSVTRECQKEISEFNRRRITVIDTPGLFDTGVDNVETRKEIVKCVSMAAPGPHVFLLVLQLGRFTQEEKDAVKMIQETFGDKSGMYTMVLFTRGDDLKGASVENFIEDDNSLQYLIHQCGKRYHVFNNTETEDLTQVSDLLEKIDRMVAINGGSFYTSEMFQNVEKNIRDEQARIMKEKEEEIKRKEEELKTKYEAEIEQIKKENEAERKKIQNELRKSEDDFKKREEEIKKETNENVRKELQRNLKEKQKLFEKDNKIKENALEEQQQNIIKYLEEKHEKEKQNLQEKIQKETRLQAEYEYNEKLEKEVAKALKEAEEKHEIEKAKVLQEAKENYETEKVNVLKKAEENYKLEKTKIFQETKEKQGKENYKSLQEAKEKYEREKAKALQEAEEKHETEKTNVLQEVEKKYKAEMVKALQEAAVKHRREMDEAAEKHRKEKAKALQEAAAKHKTEMDDAAEKHKAEKAKALQEYEEKLPNAAKLARDWSRTHHIVGGAAGGLVGAWQDRFGKK